MAFHIHVPKPLHGWKAFFNEIAVIVIGVLIALGLEAGVEWLHWRHKVEDGKERLRVEMIQIARGSAEQIATAPCVLAQLHAVEANLLASGETIIPSPLYSSGSFSGTAIYSLVPQTTAAWSALQLDGTINHFNPRIQYSLGMLYSNVESGRELARQSSDHMGRLRLAAFPVALDAGTRADLLQEVWSQIDRTNNRTRIATQIMARMRWTGLAPTDEAIARELDRISGMSGFSGKSHVAFCREHNLPVADWKAPVDEAEHNMLIASPGSNRQE